MTSLRIGLTFHFPPRWRKWKFLDYSFHRNTAVICVFVTPNLHTGSLIHGAAALVGVGILGRNSHKWNISFLKGGCVVLRVSSDTSTLPPRILSPAPLTHRYTQALAACYSLSRGLTAFDSSRLQNMTSCSFWRLRHLRDLRLSPCWFLPTTVNPLLWSTKISNKSSNE